MEALLIALGLVLALILILAGLTLLVAAAIVFIAGSDTDPHEVEIDPNAKIMEKYKK